MKYIVLLSVLALSTFSASAQRGNKHDQLFARVGNTITIPPPPVPPGFPTPPSIEIPVPPSPSACANAGSYTGSYYGSGSSTINLNTYGYVPNMAQSGSTYTVTRDGQNIYVGHSGGGSAYYTSGSYVAPNGTYTYVGR